MEERSAVQMLMLKETHTIETKADSSEAEIRPPRRSFAYKQLSRYRWNVLDLLNIFGKKALTCHIFADIDMSRVERIRREMDIDHHHATATAFLIKAISIAQKSNPESRSHRLPGARIVTFDEVVAGFTAEREVDGQPIVFFGEIDDPCNKSIWQLSCELKEYAEADLMQVDKLREQVLFCRIPWIFRQVILTLSSWFPTLRLRCMRATFGLSSLGALGITVACGPSVCTSVFGVGAVEKRAVVDENDQIVIKPMLTLALSYDRRAMERTDAERFLADVRKYLEQEIEA